MKSVYREFVKLDHPFPNEEILLVQKLHQEGKISKEDLEKISNLIHKYLNLRADVFYED
jgi:hypothetical protein